MKNKQLFIAYYYNGESEQDAELYIGKTGIDEEFIKYFENSYGATMKDDDIVGIYPVVKEMGIDGKMYKIKI